MASGSLTMTPTLAPQDDSNRPTSITPGEFPTGHREFHTMNHAFPKSQIGRRPYISDIGAMSIGATPMPRKKIENMICPVVASISRSWFISPRAGAIIEADMVVMSWLVEHITPIVILRHEDQL